MSTVSDGESREDPLNAAAWLEAVKQDLAIAVIRADSLEYSLTLARLAIAAGMRQIEITSTSQDFLQAIACLRADYPHCTIGTGTVVSADIARESLAAGAQFIFAPYYTAER